MATTPSVPGRQAVVQRWRRLASALALICAAAAVSVVPRAAYACAFDMIKPSRTQIDWIVDADRLVLARPSAGNAFAYEVESILVGADAGPAIGHLVDSRNRRRLSANPSHAMLFAYLPDVGWHQVAYVDEGFRPLLDAALENRDEWRGGMTASRQAFVARLQESDDPLHKTIVIGELDKVPYEELREFAVRIPPDALLRDLWTPAGYPYQAIRALLLGLSGTAEARAEIGDFIARVETWEWADNLGAFAAAYIEMEGPGGVDHLSGRMLADPGQPLDKIEQLVMAMAVHHALDDTEKSDAVARAIARLVTLRPEAGAVVARQFALRADWSQSAVLEPLVRERRLAGLQDLLTVSVYLARAREDAAQ